MLMEHRQPARCRRTLRMWPTSEFKKRVLYLSRPARIVWVMPKKAAVLPPVPFKKPAAVIKPIEPLPPLRLGQKPVKRLQKRSRP